MKYHRSILAASLVLLGGRTLAREPQAPPSPYAATTGQPSGGSNVFVGTVGGIIELPYGWTADPVMRGEAEIVRIHRKSINDFDVKPFNPKPSDYKPENFEALGLMELMVIPKNAPGGFKSLAELRQAKEKELLSSGAEYEITDVPSRSEWPKGTFDVATSRPYRLRQTYGESEKEFYILTSAGSPSESAQTKDKHRALDYRHTLETVDRSLGRHLLDIREHAGAGRWFTSEDNAPPNPGSPNAFRIIAAFAVPIAAMVAFVLWPEKSARSAKFRLYGQALFLFSLTSAIAGFLTIYIPARFSQLVWRHVQDALIVASLPNLLIAYGAARGFGNRHTRRILVSVTALLILWSAIWFLEPRGANLDSTEEVLIGVPLILFYLGILAASVFTAAFGPVSPVKE